MMPSFGCEGRDRYGLFLLVADKAIGVARVRGYSVHSHQSNVDVLGVKGHSVQTHQSKYPEDPITF